MGLTGIHILGQNETSQKFTFYSFSIMPSNHLLEITSSVE